MVKYPLEETLFRDARVARQRNVKAACLFFVHIFSPFFFFLYPTMCVRFLV